MPEALKKYVVIFSDHEKGDPGLVPKGIKCVTLIVQTGSTLLVEVEVGVLILQPTYSRPVTPDQ